MHVLKLCRIIPLESTDYVAKKYSNMKNIKITYKVKSSTDDTDLTQRTVELDKNFIKQKDEWNCGPIACLSVFELFYEKKILDGMDVKNYRHTVMHHFKSLLAKLQDDMYLYDGKDRI